MPNWIIVSIVSGGTGIISFAAGIFILKNPPSKFDVPDEIQKEIDRQAPVKIITRRWTTTAFLIGILGIGYSLFNLIAHLVN